MTHVQRYASKSRKPNVCPATGAVVDALEGRLMFAAGAVLGENLTVQVNGTEGADTITITPGFNGDGRPVLNVEIKTPSETIRKSFVTSESTPPSPSNPYPTVKTLVNRVVVASGGGNDFINGASANMPMFANSGAGNDTVIGSLAADTLYGGAGNDRVNGAPSTGGAFQFNDEIWGDSPIIGGNNTGNDTLAGSNGHDTVHGGGGNDSIFGSYGNDVLHAGSGHDTVYGNDGHDKLYGETGSDRLEGHKGNDSLYGGDAADDLYGNDGGDWIYGGAGNDYVRAGAGMDYAYGEAGFDILFGGDDADILYAHTAAAPDAAGVASGDFIEGENGNDQIHGGSGNDQLTGGAGNDWIAGYSGNDTLLGGQGADTVWSGGGNDVLHHTSWFEASDGATDLLKGESGTDEFYISKVDVWELWNTDRKSNEKLVRA